MENSPTEQGVVQPASNEPTGQEQQSQVSAEQNQETNSREQSQGSVSDDTANQPQAEQQTQTQKNEGGENQTDDGLAKFAKGQGVEDISELSEREKHFLKVAYDNQRALRGGNNSQSRITDATEKLGDGSLEAEVEQLKYERTTDRFWAQDGRDKSLEPAMTAILYEKVEQLTPMLGEAEARKYAFNLSRDLDTLYGMAQLKNGPKASSVDAEAIRREERESIQRQMSANAPTAHATQGSRQSTSTVNEDWIRNEYDPRNPEHRQLVDEYYAR